MPKRMICWVIYVNRQFLTHWNIAGAALDKDLQNAFRYENERDAAFVAGKVNGKIIKCRQGENGLEVVRNEPARHDD